ncbi:MAG: HypC/HybG/HupF family hydrogenase formation chaperone [Candidatus Moranbacteria bacterium]|nr:HypC/HybG/HupF family hydrogenase formation chaperone [Candidatus Moranbacteria bacterium]
MCLTIPKKVIVVEKDFVIVENPSGDRQKVKSMIDLKIGDYCLTQQGIVVEKIGEGEARKIFKILKKGEK